MHIRIPVSRHAKQNSISTLFYGNTHLQKCDLRQWSDREVSADWEPYLAHPCSSSSISRRDTVQAHGLGSVLASIFIYLPVGGPLAWRPHVARCLRLRFREPFIWRGDCAGDTRYNFILAVSGAAIFISQTVMSQDLPAWQCVYAVSPHVPSPAVHPR